jgi:hypothetical protein
VDLSPLWHPASLHPDLLLPVAEGWVAQQFSFMLWRVLESGHGPPLRAVEAARPRSILAPPPVWQTDVVGAIPLRLERPSYAWGHVRDRYGVAPTVSCCEQARRRDWIHPSLVQSKPLSSSPCYDVLRGAWWWRPMEVLWAQSSAR